MQTYHPTTSFGRRPATLGQIAAQVRLRQAIAAAEAPGSNAPEAVDKWRISRMLGEIRERLGVSDRSLSVLAALLSFHPETALTLPRRGEGEEESCCDLIVFPSNKALAQRAHGMAPKTLWRHLAALVEAGLITRRDSPNGKRYARRAPEGEGRFSDAFGFDLTPLVARAAEFEAMAEELQAARRRRALLKERIALLRRDVTKSIALGLDERLAGDWEAYRRRAMALMTPLRSLRGEAELEALALDLAALRADVAKTLESQVDAENPWCNDGLSDAHQSISKDISHHDLEPASKEEGADVAHQEGRRQEGMAPERKSAEPPSYPLGLVLEACPDIRDYGPGGAVRSWSDFLDAVGAIRPMIGISPDAWREAQEALGRLEAHVAVAGILQRSIHSSEAQTVPGSRPGATAIVVNGSPAIQSPGGYLRALAEKARTGEFALGPVLMALIGQRLKARRGKAQAGSA